MEKKEPKKKYTMFQVITRQLRTIHERKRDRIYVYYILYMICAGTLPLIAIYLPRIVIDYLQAGQDATTVVQTILWLVGLSFLLALGMEIPKRQTDILFLSLRLSEFKNYTDWYQKIDYAFMEDPTFRDRVEISTQSLGSNQIGFEGAYHDLLEILPMLLSILLFSLLIGLFQPLIFLACMLGTAVSVWIKSRITKYALSRKEDEARARRRRTYFYETCYDFTFGKETRVFNMEKKLSEDFRKKSHDYIQVIRDMQNNQFRLGLLELAMLLIQDGLAYFFVIKGYFDGLLSFGEVALYIGAVIALSTTLRNLSDRVSRMDKNTQLTSDYYEFIDDKGFFSAKGTRSAIPPEETLEIEFRDVSFKYPKTDRYILTHFNFVIHKGEKLAIVGMNGAGKSTIVKLITNMFCVTEGTILVNGIAIDQFDAGELQKMFSVVFQDVNVFALTVLENVVGDDHSEEGMKRGIDALDRVGLKEKIESLPHQYDTPLLKVIEDDGVELSGGQSQKLAIARALYKNANMVILDEPTASLDALAEAEIYQKFNDLVQNKTTVYISHRLSSTKFCDKIAMFSTEGLIEYGTHDELMEKQGAYYFMFTTQGKYYQSGVEENA